MSNISSYKSRNAHSKSNAITPFIIEAQSIVKLNIDQQKQRLRQNDDML